MNMKNLNIRTLIYTLISAALGLSLVTILRDDMFISNLLAGNGRFAMWHAAWHIIENNPLWGSSRPLYQEYYRAAWDIVHRFPEARYDKFLKSVGHPHNDFLGIAAYFGIPALLAYIAFMVSLLCWSWSLRNQNKKVANTMMALLCFVFIASLAENYSDYSSTFYVMLAAFALLFKQAQLKAFTKKNEQL